MRNRGLLFSVIIGAINFAFVSGAGAAIVTFNDRATFLAHTSSSTTIDFGGIAPNGNFTLFETPSGLTLSGVNFVGLPSNGFGLFVVDGNFCCATYTQRGGQVASLASPLSGPNGNSPIQVNLPNGTNAVGLDLFSVTNGDVAGVLTDTVQIKVGADTFLVPTAPLSVGNGRVFFGFVSDTAVSSFSIDPTRTDIITSTNVVNFAFGVAAPVPLPAAFWLLGSALGGIGFARRRVTS